MEKIKAHVNKEGYLEISNQKLKKLINKDIDIIVHNGNDNSNNNNNNRNDFFDLLENGPKVKGPKGKITKEWIHERGKEDSRHR